jgi:hypothetical protein
MRSGEVMDNCLTYALKMARYSRDANHLVIRNAHFCFFPHFSVLFELANGDLVRKEYLPLKPIPRWLPSLFVSGMEVTTTYRLESIEVSSGSKHVSILPSFETDKH